MSTRVLRIAVLSAVVLLVGCADVLRTAAAVVNGHVITDTEVQRQLDLALTDPAADAQLGAGQAREEAIRDAARQLLSVLIQEWLVTEYAEAKAIEADPAAVDTALAQTVQQAGGQEAFLAALRERGLSLSDVRENIERVLVYRAVQEQVVREAISEAELRAEYADRSDEFTEVNLAHIVLTTPGDAERVRTLATPANFARLARQESADLESAPRGGDLGFLRIVQLPPPLAQAVLETRVGRVGGPVATDQGFVVFLVKERRPVPFVEVRAELLQERSETAFQQWLAARIAAAEIRVNPRYGRLEPATGRVVAITSTEESPPPVQLSP